MSTVNQTIRELQIQRNRGQRHLEKLSLAIKALEQLGGSIAGETEPKRKLSAAARAKIVAAQKARWAKYNAEMAKAGKK
jgi:hypothetical protein